MKLVGILILAVLVLSLGPFITQWAWSNSITSVFGIREIGWVEAFAFNMLGSMLFKNSNFSSSNK